jgi:hypothetical protein
VALTGAIEYQITDLMLTANSIAIVGEFPLCGVHDEALAQALESESPAIGGALAGVMLRPHCRTSGQPCQQAAMPNGRSRMHGGRSTGRRRVTGTTSGAEAIAGRREIRELVRAMRALACATEEV